MKAESLEDLIGRWRTDLLANGATAAHTTAGEATLREHLAVLAAAGLEPEEAFLVALHRLAQGDDLTVKFARSYSGEAWAPPVAGAPERIADAGERREFWAMLGCAIAAALAFKAPELFGYDFNGDGAEFYALNLSFFVLPFLAGYFVWRRGVGLRVVAAMAAVFVVAAVVVNAYPFASGGASEVLAAIHLPIVLWLTVGVAHAAGEWRSDARRMEFVRFTGEWLITYVLIALGGGVLIALTIGVFEAIGLSASSFVESWVLPCGAMGAVIVSTWLVGTRRNLVGGMAPMLARVFTPLFAIMCVALLVGVIWTRGIVHVEREVLIVFDVLLVLVLALLLYGISARDRHAPAGAFDWIQLALLVSALGVDLFALMNIARRLTEYGFSPNKTAALGLNLLLLVNLAWSAFLQVGFLRSARGVESVERWQMRYLPVYAVWAAVVVVAFPPLFGFV
ncbi:MAG: hypothetical protein HGB10_11790 [Coriobacteriia bacterium]|nr:hypothetical protein [Coriobacteriia bacterium]